MTRRQRVRLAVGVFIAALLVMLIATGTLPYARYRQLDLNSGRERMVHSAFGINIRISERPTVFSRFANEHLGRTGPPRWRTAHRWTPFSDARIHYRAGGQAHDLNTFGVWLEHTDAPPEAKKRIATRVFEIITAGERPLIWATIDGEIEVYDATWERLIDRWPPAENISEKPSR